MDNQSFEASFRAFMVALFVGIADALICLIYNVVFRSGKPYFSSDIINVSYIIFGMIFLFAMIGVVHLLVLRLFARGSLVFSILFVILTGVTLAAIRSGHFSADPVESDLLRGELTGIVIVAGVSAFVGIPVLHGSHRFELYVV